MSLIYILTPTTGRPAAEYVVSVLRTAVELREAGVPHVFGLVSGKSPVQLARAEAVHRFLAFDQATHLLFVDDDMVFAPSDVVALLAAEKPIVGAVCALKRESVAYAVHASTNAVVVVEDDLVSVDGIGTGFVMIERRVVEAVAAETPELEVAPNVYRKMVFDSGDVGGKWLSEDHNFCRRAALLGYTSWAHTALDVGHVGTHTFRGRHSPSQKVLLLTSAYDGEG